MILKVNRPAADPLGMWLVRTEDKTTKVLLHQGDIPAKVQEAVRKNAGRAYFNGEVVGKKVTFADQVPGLNW